MNVLFYSHFILAILHSLLFTVSCVLSVVIKNPYSVQLGLVYLSRDLHLQLLLLPIGNPFSPLWFSVIYTLAAALDHWYTVFTYHHYICLIKEKRAITQRWTEYSISAGFMNLQIAMLCGVFDILMLILLLSMTFVLMNFGKEIEADQSKKVIPKLFAWCAFSVVWASIITVFAVVLFHDTNHQIPNFVMAIIVSLFILQSLFGVVQAVFTEDLIIRELAFNLLSLVAKTVLFALVTSGCINKK